MNRVNAFRLLVVVVAIAALEALCLAGLIDKITMQPPHLIARDLYRLLVSGRMNRDTLDPLFATYYAVPVFAFYPFFIVVFGLGDIPQILIAFLLGVVAMIVNTLNGLDRVPSVLLKTARVLKLSSVDTALRVTLPSAGPYLLTGAKLAIAYAFIGVIGSEFILSRGGIGYEISFAYTSFDNATMYPLIVLILLASIVINGALSRWERRLLGRRGLQ